MKLSIKKKMLILWLISVSAGSISLTGLLLLTATGDPAALLRLMRTYKTIHQEYFLGVSDTDLLNGAAQGMVDALGDPYSNFLTGDAFDSLMEQTNGEYGGIGVVIGSDGEAHTYVLSVFPGSTAEAAGLLPGDEILMVDDAPVSAADLESTAKKIRGLSGTEVTLSVLRDETEKNVTVSRSNVSLPTVQSYMADDGIGYIHIYSFSSHTAEEFRTQYEKLREAGMDRLILDLRMNPGGLIDSVVAVADQILSGGPVVSYQEKNGNTQVFSIKGTDDPLSLVVLMDRNSASASEILAGAVQDKKAGTVMGERSYGKGTVQVIHPMDGREALKLSVAQYLTAAGRRIDKIGIEPDIPVTQTGRLFDPGADSVLQEAIRFFQSRPAPEK